MLVVDEFSLFEEQNDKDCLNASMMMTREMIHSGVMKTNLLQPLLLMLPKTCYYTDNVTIELQHKPMDYKPMLLKRNHLIYLLNKDKGMLEEVVVAVVIMIGISPNSTLTIHLFVVEQKGYQWKVQVNLCLIDLVDNHLAHQNQEMEMENDLF